MAARNRTFTWDHPVVKLFVIIAVVAALAMAAEVLKPLAVAVLLSFALSPLSRVLERRGLPRIAAVLLTVIVALGSIGGIGYVVFGQLNALAEELPRSQERILERVRALRPDGKSAITKASETIDEVVKKVESAKTEAKTQGVDEQQGVVDVHVVEAPDWRNRLESEVGPYLEGFAVGTFVLILIVFMMLNREDLSDRIVQLFGRRQLTLTTRTMEDVGQRISRYLAMFATVNSCFGLTIGLGLWLIGLKYAVLWGVLAGLLRFIPYVGPAIAFGLPLTYSFAQEQSALGNWLPLGVVGLFLAVETVLNSVEPIIYGRTTGVSALSLLVAAMFWTWLWGLEGLLISTPVTVCLAVLGKYVPSLSFFSTLLGEEAELEQDVRFYQRLLALDQDGATEIAEEALKERPRAEIFDSILIAALSRAERDFAREEIDERERAFVWRVVGEIVEDLDGSEELDLESVNTVPRLNPASAPPASAVLGVAANDHGDALVLKMLRQLLAQCGCPMEIMTSEQGPSLELIEAVAEREPQLVVLSHLPPIGLTPARYLVRRLRSRHPSLPLLVGRWSETGNARRVTERLTSAGATAVLFNLSDARQRILQQFAPTEAPPFATAP